MNRPAQRPHGNLNEPQRRGLPLFWQITLLAAAVSIIPLVVAMTLSLDTATGVTEDLLQKNLRQLAKEAAQRTSYTLVSMDSDLDVMAELTLTPADFVSFSHAQRRELFSLDENGSRRRETVPKYREVSYFHPDGRAAVVVVDDQAVAEPPRFQPNANRWCEPEDFVARSLAAGGAPVVSGLVGCHVLVDQYRPADGRLNTHFSGGIRVSKAFFDAEGKPRGVASLILSQLHLVWALQSLAPQGESPGFVPLMVNREGWVIAHPDPAVTLGRDKQGAIVRGQNWDERRSVRLPDLPGEGGERFSGFLSQLNEGAPTTAIVQEESGADWVAAAVPIDAALGGYGPQRPFGAVFVLYPRAAALAVTDDLQRNLWLLVLGTALVVLLGSAFLAGSISRPIRRLAEAARALARGEVRTVPAARVDEIGDLARAFERMRQDLEVSQEALLRAERLAAIGRFVSGIIHETKNILAGLGNYMTLLERKASPEIQERILPRMRRAMAQMDTLVVRLRELALKPRFEATELHQVLRHAVELVENQAAEKGLTLVVDLPPEVALPRADASLLGQVFLNLLINALEATPANGTVALVARQSEDFVEVTVTDTGPGLPEDVPNGDLLQPFYTTKSGGTGLGLYICTSIVERHEGRFTIENQPEGGAVARVVLPRRSP